MTWIIIADEEINGLTTCSIAHMMFGMIMCYFNYSCLMTVMTQIAFEVWENCGHGEQFFSKWNDRLQIASWPKFDGDTAINSQMDNVCAAFGWYVMDLCLKWYRRRRQLKYDYMDESVNSNGYGSNGMIYAPPTLSSSSRGGPSTTTPVSWSSHEARTSTRARSTAPVSWGGSHR